MSDALQLILEDNDGTQLETSCSRFAVVWQGKELWVQACLLYTSNWDSRKMRPGGWRRFPTTTWQLRITGSVLQSPELAVISDARQNRTISTRERGRRLDLRIMRRPYR